jgi:4-amino-4-deoxy-L-arabinose transferase-like glycosyltransferase
MPNDDLRQISQEPRESATAKWIIAGIIVLLYAASLGPNWIPGPDSALYRVLARNISQGEGYTTFSRPNVTVPPGFPALLASLNAIGLDAPIWQNLVMIVLALTAILLAWLILKLQGHYQRALWVILLFALADHVHSLSMELLSDVPCLVLIALGLWAYIRWAKTGKGWPELGTLALTAAVWVRIAIVPVVLGAALGLVLQRRKPSTRRAWLNAILLGLAVGATLLAFIAWYKANATAYAFGYGYRLDNIASRGAMDWLVMLNNNVTKTSVAIARLFTGQRLGVWLAILLFMVPVLVGIVMRIAKNDVIAATATLSYLAFFLMTQEPRARYLLPISFLLMLYFSDALASFFQLSAIGRKVLPYAVPALLAGLAVANLPLDIRSVIWAHSDNFIHVYGAKDGKGEKEDQFDLTDWMRVSAAKDDKFFSAESTYVLAWLSDMPGMPISSAILSKPIEPIAFHKLLVDQKVTWFIFDHQDKKPILQLKADMLSAGLLMAEPIFHNESYDVYMLTDDRRPASQPASAIAN